MKARSILSGLMFLPLFCAIAVPARAQTGSSQQTLSQYVADLQNNPSDAALRGKIIALAQTMSPAPAIPEEARRHYVMAQAFKEKATVSTGFASAIQEYKAALLATPWWADAYEKLALAQKAANRYDDAIASLNLYLLTQPADARDAQDEIYKLEADKQAAAQAVSQAAANEQQRRQQEEQRRALEAQRTAQAENDAIAGWWRIGDESGVLDNVTHVEFHMEGSVLVGEQVFDQSAPPFPAGRRDIYGKYKKVGERRFLRMSTVSMVVAGQLVQDLPTIEFDGDRIIETHTARSITDSLYRVR